MSVPAPVTGHFLTHRSDPAVRGHFDRLVRETAGLVEWTFTADPGFLDPPGPDAGPGHPAFLMPDRFAAARRRGNIAMGFMDVAIIPLVLAQPGEHVWIIEYDVDWSGRWSDLFARFADSDADVLTSTSLTRPRSPGWTHWRWAGAPADVRRGRYRRAFHPLLRLSRRFAETFCREMADPAWQGHYEFLFPTIAATRGLKLRDFASRARAGSPLYTNNPDDAWLQPGSYVWRPARSRYFHEEPEGFPDAGRLYHPVKPPDP